MFTGCGDGVARAYDAKSATLKRVFQGHEGAINCLVCVDDKLFSGSSDGTMRVWDAKDISDDIHVDEEPPPAPPAAVVDEGLEQEVGRLENEEPEETPEDGIIDDEAPAEEPPEEPPVDADETKVADEPSSAEEVLPSG